MKKKDKESTIQEQQVELLNKYYPHYTLKANLFASLFLFGILSIIWEIQVFQETLISPWIPFSIALVTGIAITPLLRKIFNIYLFSTHNMTSKPLIVHVVFNTVSIGAMFVLMLMWGNRQFASDQKDILTVPIESSGHLTRSKDGCAEPYVMISYKGSEKQLFFPCHAPVEKYGQVLIEVGHGLFGFDVIRRKALVKGAW